MGQQLETRMIDHLAREFWGGDHRGVCLQVTATDPQPDGGGQSESYVQLTMEEAAALCNDLGGFVRREAVRRQGLLREELKRLKHAEKSVWTEVVSLPTDLMAGPELAVKMVSLYCPKVPHQPPPLEEARERREEPR